MHKRWMIKDPDPCLQVVLSNALQVHPIISQILINRGITTPEEAKVFLSASLKDLHDPFLLKDMDKAVKRINKAKERKERVVIFGDYDVDGVTSSVILKNVLDSIGIDTLNYIPHRMREGYGLSMRGVQFAKKNNVTLLIAVDCGITAHKEIEALKKNGVDTIVLDHHQPSAKGLPDAVAVINPKREDCPYPFKALAAVGLAMKLSQALLKKLPEEYLDLVAIGTIADVAQLRGENRIFVKAGLPKITSTANVGLKALLDVAKIKGKKFKPYFVGFILGPRINATGRMGSATDSLDLLLCKDDPRAYELARTLEDHNQKRQKTQASIVQEAMNLVERDINFNEHKIIVLHKEGWHKGVLGIVAARIVEKYYRPAIVLSLEEGVASGSARSIDGFHLYEALSECSAHLEEFGGHKMAAGLTIREDKLSLFRNTLNALAHKTISLDHLIPTLDIDCEVPLSELSIEFADLIDTLQPFGEGNRAPLFCSRGLTVKSHPVVVGKDTLKFWVTDGERVVSAVGFGMGKYRDELALGTKLDLAYALSIDDWNKDPTVALKLKDIRLLQPCRP